jgi:uncharacterized repeat protein (TIGR03803 family)
MTRSHALALAVFFGTSAYATAALAGKGAYTQIFSFASSGLGVAPQGLVESDGLLWGTTRNDGTYGGGTLFKLDPATGAETVVHNFGGAKGDGAQPYGNLLKMGKALYGVTSYTTAAGLGSGTVFKVNPATGTETVVHSFGGFSGDGANPVGLAASGGALFGTTFLGGAYDEKGTVFRLNPASGLETILHSFGALHDGSGPSGAPTSAGGTLYGTTDSDTPSFYKVDALTGVESVLYRPGSVSFGGLTDYNGVLVGTTVNGGHGVHGSIFQLNTTTGSYDVIYSFTGGSDGGGPAAGVIQVGGMFFGSTSYAGPNGGGTLFKLDPRTSKVVTVHGFGGTGDGAEPTALIGARGTIYGLTAAGGENGYGTVFSYVP